MRKVRTISREITPQRLPGIGKIATMLITVALAINLAANKPSYLVSGVYIPTESELQGDDFGPTRTEQIAHQVSDTYYYTIEEDENLAATEYEQRLAQTKESLVQKNFNVEIPKLCVTYLAGMHHMKAIGRQDVQEIAAYGVRVHCEGIVIE